MAEGFARALAPPGVEVFSAGLFPGPIHPLAVALMAEAGIDLSDHRPHGLDSIPWNRVGIMVCLAPELFPCLPRVPAGVRRIPWAVDVPDLGPDTERRLRSGRDVRDRIRRLVTELLDSLRREEGTP